ncbi:proline/glycine betaine ABC transporter substrate-binding protein ProX, partial [Klebsiella oxytoca]
MRNPVLWATVLSATLISTQLSAADLPGKGVSVQPVQSTISEETFQTLIVNKALEKLGYTVQPIKEVDYNVAYSSIANGDATFMAVSWVPLHNSQYE